MSRKSGSASSNVLKYIFRYILDDYKTEFRYIEDKELHKYNGKFLIRHNIRSRSLKGFIREFEENETYRIVKRKDSVKVFHTCISFSPHDRKLLDDIILKDISKKFIQEYGNNSLYLGTKHEDKEHLHLHICHSGTMLNGRSARISKARFKAIKLEMDRYQKENYPFLIHSLPDHQKSGVHDKAVLIQKLNANRNTIKAELIQNLENTFTASRTKEEFIERLAATGNKVYMRNGKIQGITFDGKIKFRFSKLGFTDDRISFLDHRERPHDPDLNQCNNLPKNRNSKENLDLVPSNNDLKEQYEKSEEIRHLKEIRERSNEMHIDQRMSESVSNSDEGSDEIQQLKQIRKRSKEMDMDLLTSEGIPEFDEYSDGGR